MVEKEKSKSEKILDIATKRGFFYPSAEIYNSKAGFWTYGSLGSRIKNKWENLWKDYFLKLNNNFYEIDDCNILPKEVFKASGHLDHFTDPLTECGKCHIRFKADQLIEEATKKDSAGLNEDQLTKLINDNKIKCVSCKGDLMPVRFFNMMFDVKVGVTNEEIMYLRPESAQSPYLAFKREFEITRRKIPLGLAVVGKVFRNEISPRQGFFRLREFTQAELQIFFDASKINDHENWNSVKKYKLLIADDKKITEITCEQLSKKIPKFIVYYMAKVQIFYLDLLKIPKAKFRFREVNEKERAFYNKTHFDIEADLETLGGWVELGGVHYRTDHDLAGHQKGSKEKLEITIDENNKINKFIPHVLELSFGVDRNIWALLDLFYKEEKERTIFNFPSVILPIDVAVFPLVNKKTLPRLAEKIYKDLFKDFQVFYDDSGAIGRRYRRQDEIGTKLGITVDFDSIKKKDVTLRDRDTMKQKRIKITKLKDKINEILRENKKF